MPYYPDQPFFLQHLGQEFLLPDAHEVLLLLSCQDAGSNEIQEIFSVILRGPRDHFLPQRTYRFEKEGLEPFDMFIVPVGHDRQGIYYEAFFNRHRSGPA